MSSTSFPASVDSASDSKEPECEPSRSVKSTPIASESSASIGQMSLFGEMSEPLTPTGLWPTPSASVAQLGEKPPTWLARRERLKKTANNGNGAGMPLTIAVQLNSSAAASPVRTSVLPEKARALKALARDYGASTPELLAKYDPATSSWRTSQLCLDGALAEFSETWPRSGLMRSGTAFLLPPLVPLTDETECGLWRTPDASIVSGGAANRRESKETGARDWAARSSQHAVDVADASEPQDYRHPNAKPYSERGGGKSERRAIAECGVVAR